MFNFKEITIIVELDEFSKMIKYHTNLRFDKFNKKFYWGEDVLINWKFVDFNTNKDVWHDANGL